jgi:hypothetical protein
MGFRTGFAIGATFTAALAMVSINPTRMRTQAPASTWYRGWTCVWENGNPIKPADQQGTCVGWVSCRHESMLFVIPQTHRVECSSKGGPCSADICFVDYYKARGGRR